MRPEMASRLAGDIAQVPGAGSAVVEAGGAVGAAPDDGRAERTAALARFVLARGRAAAGEDDLRGLGRVLAESSLEQVSFAGPGGEGAVLVFEGGWLFARLERGVGAEELSPTLWAAVRRYQGFTDEPARPAQEVSHADPA